MALCLSSLAFSEEDAIILKSQKAAAQREQRLFESMNPTKSEIKTPDVETNEPSAPTQPSEGDPGTSSARPQAEPTALPAVNDRAPTPAPYGEGRTPPINGSETIQPNHETPASKSISGEPPSATETSIIPAVSTEDPAVSSVSPSNQTLQGPAFERSPSVGRSVLTTSSETPSEKDVASDGTEQTSNVTYYIPDDLTERSAESHNLNIHQPQWLDQLRLRQNRSKLNDFKYLGPSGAGALAVRPQRTIYSSIVAGVGPNETQLLSGEIGVVPTKINVSFSLWGERAKWLDAQTNTGKLATTFYGIICSGGISRGSTVALTPCVGGGMSSGVFKDRDYQNDIVQHYVGFRPVKTASLKGLLVYNLLGKNVIDWSAGYVEDVFLWGGYARVMTSTPIPTVYIGVQTHGIQRNAAIVSTTVTY